MTRQAQSCRPPQARLHPPPQLTMATTLASLSRRGAAAEESWAKKEMELQAAALRELLEASPAGRARLAAHALAPPQTHSMLPSIARQYLRLDAPNQARGRAWRSSGRLRVAVAVRGRALRGQRTA